MVSTPSPPAPPDPIVTSTAQSQSNLATAQAQQAGNNINQYTPQGSLEYSQRGTQTITLPDGTKTDIPTYSATTTLSPDQQKLYDLANTANFNLGTIGNQQITKVGDILNTPFDLNAATKAQQQDYTKTLLDPQRDRQLAALEAKLNNQGIRPGQEAYTNAMTDFNNQWQNNYNSMDLASQAQAANQALTQRNQPLNEISALMSGSQVSQPNFVSTPQTPVQPTDVSGNYNANYAQQMQAYNAQVNNKNAMLGGIFGIPTALLGGWARTGFS